MCPADPSPCVLTPALHGEVRAVLALVRRHHHEHPVPRAPRPLQQFWRVLCGAPIPLQRARPLCLHTLRAFSPQALVLAADVLLFDEAVQRGPERRQVQSSRAALLQVGHPAQEVT